MLNKKPKIGLLGLSLKLYDESMPELKLGREKFVQKIIRKFDSFANIDFSGACNSRESVEKEINRFEAADYDGIMVIMLTYAPSLIALKPLSKTKLPIIIFNTQEAKGIPKTGTSKLMLDNHGVHGVQDLCSVLNRTKKEYKVISGHWQDDKILKKLADIIKAAHIASIIEKINIGLIGYSMQDMGDFNIDETMLLSEVGPHVVHIDVDEVADLIEEAHEEEIKDIINYDRKHYQFSNKINKEEHKASAAFEWSIRKLIDKYNLSGWTQNFNALAKSERIPVLPFLPASKLMAEGYGYAAEGDVNGVISFIILNILGGQSTLTEMFSIDFTDGAVFMSHMGELNIGMAREDEPVRVIKKSFPMVDKLSPPTPVFSLKPGKTTLLSLTPGKEGTFKIIISEGEVMDFKHVKNIDAPNFKWKPDQKLEIFLDKYAEAGGSHHQAMAYGNLIETIEVLGKFMDIEIIRI